MIIPAFQNTQFTEQNGNLTSIQQIWLDNLLQNMQAALSDDGWTVPAHTTAEITSLAQRMPAGTIFFDTDVAKLKVVTAAAIVSPPTPAIVQQITSV